MFRLIALLLVALLVLLQVKFWAGEGGWREVEALEQSVARQRAENARLKLRNDALSAEVEDLKTGDAAIEERARSELGMIRPGETFYRVVEDAPAAQPADGDGRQ
ncbi:cell division protein FtsB [Coralloluteibacterium stylophorae]|uniref:Cell division protein FtsB n=1 Tax=Coralloluteibacterium stylophorae TaxID=1776034 RepID=A0A8J8AZT5_9GAMM|nr:cell division protein FtsB [Coralloluteibacterium stylophorae]